MELSVALLLWGAAAAFALAAAVDWLLYRGATLMPYAPVLGNVPTLLAEHGRLNAYIAARCKAVGYPAHGLIKLGVFEPQKLWMIFTPADVEYVMKTKFDNFVYKGFRDPQFDDLFGSGIFNADGAHWLVQRKLAAREFSAERFRGYMAGVFVKDAAKLVGIIEGPGAGPGAQWSSEFNASKWLMRLTMDAFSQISFGVDIGGLDGKPCEFADAFDVCQAQIFQRMVVLRPFWRAMRALNVGPEAAYARALTVVNAFAYDLIDGVIDRNDLAKSQGREAKDDLMSRLIPVAQEEAGGAIDRKLVRDMCLNLLIAGRDTTAAALQWLLYELTRNPAVDAELHEELEAALGDAAPNFDNCAGLEFAQAVVWETMRLYPSVPYGTKCARESDVLPSGLQVAKGDSVNWATYAMGRRPDIWGADAETWRPARWMGADGKCKREGQYKLPAFNGGRRLCLGMDMAFLEIKVVLATLLRRYRFALKPGQNVRSRTTLTLQMHDDLVLIASRR
jgi:cytochrome P450